MVRKREDVRAYCFTVNNWTQKDLLDVQQMGNHVSQYCIYGFEVGEQGTPHIQGYVYFKNTKSIKACNTLVPRAHFIKANGSAKDSYNYIANNKDKPNPEFYEIGKMPEMGKIGREQLEEVMNNPMDNMRLFNQYRRSYTAALTIERSKKYPKMEYYFASINYLSMVRVILKDKVIVNVFKFEELDAFTEYDVILLHVEHFDDQNLIKYLKLYPKGHMVPMYKHGYEQRRIYADMLVVVNYNKYLKKSLIEAGYKSIKNLEIYNGVEEEELQKEE